MGYCKGRPVKALEEHVYICENRVDKTARLFHKISKPKYPLCMKWFAFHVFDFKLRPQRTYTPHEVPDNYSKKALSTSTNKKGGNDDTRVQSTNKSDNTAPHSCTSSVISKQGGTKKTTSNKQSSCKGKAKSSEQEPNQLGNNASASNATSKNKNKLDDTLLRLLSKMPKKNAVDASYLLEHDKRPRKRKVW